MLVPQKYKFIVQLGRALHKYGVPSYKQQIFLTEIADKKGIKASFMDTPTWINYVFYEEDEQTYNHVECIPPGELNLGALSKIVEITNQVLDNTISFKKAKFEIESLENAKTGYGALEELLAFMLSSASFCIILNTNWTSVFVAAFLGAVIFMITHLSKKSAYIRSTLESLVSFISTLITGLLSLYFTDLNISMTILASIIVFIPGLSITTALEEITSKNLVSGTAKLFDALVSLFKQFFGVILGLAIISLFIEMKPAVFIDDIPKWMDYLAVIGLSLALLPSFKVRRRDIFLSALTGFIAFTSTFLLAFTGILVSIFLGTIITVFVSRLFSHINKSPRLVFLTTGIIMLVPGSKAFIGLSSIFLNSTGGSHPNMGMQVFYIFMGIIGGLVFSGSFIIPETKKNKTGKQADVQSITDHFSQGK